MKKEAVGNLGEEELNFLKMVRMTRADTRRDAEALFSASHQCRARDLALMEKLFVQTPGSINMGYNLAKTASADEALFEQFEKIKVAYNVHHFFEADAHLSDAQRRYPELQKVAARPSMTLKKTKDCAPTGGSSHGRSLAGSNS